MVGHSEKLNFEICCYAWTVRRKKEIQGNFNGGNFLVQNLNIDDGDMNQSPESYEEQKATLGVYSFRFESGGGLGKELESFQVTADVPSFMDGDSSSNYRSPSVNMSPSSLSLRRPSRMLINYRYISYPDDSALSQASTTLYSLTPDYNFLLSSRCNTRQVRLGGWSSHFLFFFFMPPERTRKR